MSYETLIVERRGHVGWLVFDRPDAPVIPRKAFCG